MTFQMTYASAIHNNAIRAFITGLLIFGGLMMAMDTSASVDTKSVVFDIKPGVMVVDSNGVKFSVSLKSPEFIFTDGSKAESTNLLKTTGDLKAGKPVEFSYAPITVDKIGKLEIKLFLQWFPKEAVIRKWAAYRLSESKITSVVAEIILDRLDAASYRKNIITDLYQSYPAFMKGYFAGVEFPVASTRIEGSTVILAHKPGLKMTPGVWYETRKALYGITPVDAERDAFLKYVEMNRPKPNDLHVCYNNWWSTEGPTGLAATESEALRLMKAFDENLFQPYGVKFDSFVIDMGWSAIGGLFEINKTYFPNGFTKFKETAHSMNMHPGLWVSPCYGYGILDPKWPGLKDYETFDVPHWNDATITDKYACLAGKNYQKRFKDVLVDFVKNTGVRQIKLDGYRYTCPNADHGHEPGDLSAEVVAEGFIGVLNAATGAAPGVWLEPTCFGPHSSPWWAFHCTSVTGFFGDDAPYGRIPCPTYHESYTTARDFFNLQGAALFEFPINAQEVLGIVHQSPDPFMNDGVITVLRGHMFLPLYVNPRYMNDARWRMLAGLVNWARKNQSTLRETVPILPESWQDGKLTRIDYVVPMPREPYGYAHWKGGKGIVAVRNPWVVPQSIALKLDASTGVPADSKELSVVSLYPEPRLYGKDLAFGDTLNVPLAPYETVVLSIGTRQRTAGLPLVGDAIDKKIASTVSRSELKRVVLPGQAEETSGFTLNLDAQVTIKSPDAKLLLLLEGDKKVPDSAVCNIRINGKKARPIEKFTLESWAEAEKYRNIAFAASSIPPAERWRFLEIPLSRGANDITIELLSGNDCVKVSAWVWATRPGGGISEYPNSLPEPDILSLDGAALLEAVETSSIK
ncbi:MAG: alpha-amylase family protein [Armatimonadota bacterium]